MEPFVITTESYQETLTRMLENIRSRRQDGLKTRHVLIVPDKYTLVCELKLFAGTKGAFDAEVLTLNRLFYRLTAEKNYLSREGGVMLVRSICAQMELKCFQKSASFTGFAERVYDTMLMLDENGVDIAGLRGTGAAGLKIEDIQAIYREYVRRIGGKFVDRCGRLQMIRAAICDGHSFVRGTHFYFANFSEFTKLEEEIIAALCSHAAGVTVGKATEGKQPAGKMELYECAGNILPLKAAAARIRSAAFEGMRFRDMCIVTSKTSYLQAARILREFGIPFYLDYRLQLSQDALALFVLRSFDALLRGFRRTDMLELSKNKYMHISKEDSDCLENLCNGYNVDFKGFAEDFDPERMDPGVLNETLRRNFGCAERARKRLMRYLSELNAQLSKTMTAENFGRAVEFVLHIAGEGRLQKQQDILYTDVSARILEITKLIHSILAEEEKPLAFLLDLLKDGLASAHISGLPNLSDQVIIGDAATFRGQSFKKIFILGFHEGELPEHTADSGLFSDRELTGALKEANKLTASARNRAAKFELGQLLLGAQDFFVTYDPSPGLGLSSFLKKLIAKTDMQVYYNTFFQEQTMLYTTDNPDVIARHASSAGNAMEMLISGASEYRARRLTYPYLAELYYALEEYEVDRYLTSAPSLTRIESAPQLYFRDGITSVSQLQEYFACPYSFFVRYGLKAKERSKSELTPIDIGTILHQVIEWFVPRRAEGSTQQVVSRIISQILTARPSYRNKLDAQSLEYLEKEAVYVCGIFLSHLRGGKFLPVGQEISFGGKSGYKTVTFRHKGRTVLLKGSIDMADTYNDYIRIIDYKTGYIKFDYSDIFYGRKLQLPLYMQVMLDNGYKPAAFFYFPFQMRWNDDRYSHKFQGVFNSDMELVLAQDMSLLEGGKSSIISVKTENTGEEVRIQGRRDYALDTQQLQRICRYAKHAAQGAVEEILDGYIAASPYRAGGKRPCDYCAYTVICGEQEKRVRTLHKGVKPFSDTQAFSKISKLDAAAQDLRRHKKAGKERGHGME